MCEFLKTQIRAQPHSTRCHTRPTPTPPTLLHHEKFCFQFFIGASFFFAYPTLKMALPHSQSDFPCIKGFEGFLRAFFALNDF